MFVPGVGKLISSKGMSIDAAGELLHERGFFVERPTEADVLDMLERAATGGEKIFSLRRGPSEMARATRFDDAELEYAWQALADRVDADAIDDDLVRDVAALAAQDMDGGEAVALALDWRLYQTADMVRHESGDPYHDRLHSEDDDARAAVGRNPDIDARDDGYEPFAGDASGGGADLAAGGWERLDELEAAGLAGPVPLAPGASHGLDDPDGAGAAAIADSLDHDVRAALAGARAFSSDERRALLISEVQGRAGNEIGAGPIRAAVSADRFDAIARGAVPNDDELARIIVNDADFDQAYGIWVARTREAETVHPDALATGLARMERDREAAGRAPVPADWDGDAADAFVVLYRDPLDRGAAVDPAIAGHQRQQTQLGAKSPLRGKAEQEGTSGAPLFDAVDQPGFRLDEGGDDRAIDEILGEIDADEAAIKAARDCL